MNLNKVLIKIKANKSGSLPLLQMLSITMVFDRLIWELNRAAETALFERLLIHFIISLHGVIDSTFNKSID